MSPQNVNTHTHTHSLLNHCGNAAKKKALVTSVNMVIQRKES